METQSPESPLLSLVEQIKQAALQEQTQTLAPGSNPSTSPAPSHFQLLGLIDKLRLAVETPTETVLRLIYQPPQNAALRTVMDLGIFPLLMANGKRGVSAVELAERTGAERGLVVRLMRVITALGLCASPEFELYFANDKTPVLTQPIGRDGIPCIYDLTLPTLSQLPTYFREHSYLTPKEYSKSPMQWAVGQSQFEWLAAHKPRQALFNSYMASRRHGKPAWFDVYPVERLTDGVREHPEAVFLVDVGGNQGHDLVRFHDSFPDVKGQLVLQDLPKVVNKAPVGDGDGGRIVSMGYSFLDPQPVKGARAYYFRAIFHDWPDHICRKILVNTVSAMDPTYSRIIISDFVLPDTDVPLFQASLDIQMMSIGSGVERSERQWREMLDEAGLEITGIWCDNPGMESVIEAVRRGSAATAAAAAAAA
ncbi:S-adenosyl-L-methionine-dependent methyltransferase [Aspergillus heteromorphus CBS 117.55]|uniref:S-adenosyl-L-methionine-dependent methyltransferase n=1 Tax=Aspergillus heteromorphus CBS 117.55 TaxID=1448321 RepID=A0A317VM69_9EURO|nr:S-adenosyl-L-methionine-dependent methyltransferase [Aspergillus heteromorphus CBS 117.55]PWY74331.1 S-adenosyl-L-methionine-dependent methyltransferase [Aspergillus heteromorphus CBS 117.55]